MARLPYETASVQSIQSPSQRPHQQSLSSASSVQTVNNDTINDDDGIDELLADLDEESIFGDF